MRLIALVPLAFILCAPVNAQVNGRYLSPPLPVRPDSYQCSQYARDYVRHQGERGGGVEGAVGGAVRGAVLGGIVDGRDGARRGARVGGAIGGVRGVREQRRDNGWLYQRAYDECMYYRPRY